MAIIKNTFLKGKMNKDLDERLIPKGEYIEAQNVHISESEDSDVGAIENVLGNVIAYNTAQAFPNDSQASVIGYCNDYKNKRIIYFVTNFSGSGDAIRNISRAKGAGTSGYSGGSNDTCRIMMYDTSAGTIHTLVDGAWLNLSKNHLITGVNVIDDLLFFTDDYNQPRKINIASALTKTDGTYYTNEEQISVAKYAPYSTIRLTNNSGVSGLSRDGNIKSEYLKERFVRFSYRYKYEDGEYSLIAPFTQIIFKPLNDGLISHHDDATTKDSNGDGTNNITTTEPDVPVSEQDIYKKTKVDIMQNSINKAILRIPIPNADEHKTSDYTANTYSNDYKIKTIEILLKESDGVSFKVVKEIKVQDNNAFVDNVESYTIKPLSSGSTYYRQVYKYTYKSEKPFKVLPEDQITRVFDQVPIRAKAQEVVGNRVVYGNYEQDYPYPVDNAGNRGIKYNILSINKGDQEFNSGSHHTSGHIQYNAEAYKHHSVKQRRTYQVGIVFSDRFGRQSPVILSTSTGDITDTFTVAADTRDLSAQFNSGYSWSDERAVVGKSLNINFEEDSLLGDAKGIYNGTFGADYNPHGWYSYRIVVKQTEQDYHNIYTSFNFDGWDNIENARDISNAGRSWLSLYGDNINKVPRAINDQDINRPGISGSDAELFPKVVFDYQNNGNSPRSLIQKQLTEPAEVISLGSAFEQNLFVSSENNKSGTGGFSVFDFVYGKDKNPLVAELPNLKKYYTFDPGANSLDTVTGNDLSNVGIVGADATDAVEFVVHDVDNGGEFNENTLFDNPSFLHNITASAIKNKGKTKVVGHSETNIVGGSVSNTLDKISCLPGVTLKKGDFVLFSRYFEGLAVFETKPFESLIDIYYETSTCGLVKDLDLQMSGASSANAPGNIGWDTNGDGSVNSTSVDLAENSASSTRVGGSSCVLFATDNQGSSNVTFAKVYLRDGNGNDVSSKVSITSAGVVTTSGAFAFKNTGVDAHTLRVQATDPDNGAVAYANLTINITNSVPTFNPATLGNVSIANNIGANQVVFTAQVSNGAGLSSENTIGLTQSFSFPVNAYTSYFTLTRNGTTLRLKTTSQFTESNANAFFNDSTPSNKDITITLDDGHPSNNTATRVTRIEKLDAGTQGRLFWEGSTVPTDGTLCCSTSYNTYYATEGSASGSNVPSNGGDVTNGLELFVNNVVYTNSNLSSKAPAGVYSMGTVSGQEYYYIINSDGKVTSKVACTCTN